MHTGEQLPLTLGRYRLLARIAAGGMGAVYLARVQGELGFSRVVAVKLLHAHLAEDEETLLRFLDEARVAARIVHPHVVTVHDVVSAEGRVFLVLEYVHGESLAGLLKNSAARDLEVPLQVVSAIVGDMLEGLHAAHEAVDDRGAPLGVVHRDVSPQNVLVSTKGSAYVTDFGIAKLKDQVCATRTGDMVGKPGYMAPEQLTSGTVTRATDVYGAGIVLWELLTGRRLFSGFERQMEANVRRDVAPKPSLLRKDVPPALDDLVIAMLAHAPESRPATAIAAARALNKAVPPADSTDVAEWVMTFASGKLDRLDAAMRTSTSDATEAGTFVAASYAAVATVNDSSASRWRRRAQTSIAAVAGAVVVAAFIALLVARGTNAAVPPLASPERVGAATSNAPPSTAPVDVPTVAPDGSASSASSAGSAPSVEVAPRPARAATLTQPRKTPAARPTPRTAPRPSVDCSTPFVIGPDNVRRYKKECFGTRP